MRYLSLIISLFFLVSCQTIRFVKNNKYLENIETQNIGVSTKLHHIGLLGLHEYSDPVSEKRICGSDEHIYTETYTGWKEFLIKYFGGFLLIPLFWSPLSVDVACIFKNDSDHDISSIDFEEDEFNFKVLKLKQGKALIQFISKVPEGFTTFTVFNNKKIEITKIKYKTAIIIFNNIEFKKNNTYTATLIRN